MPPEPNLYFYFVLGIVIGLYLLDLLSNLLNLQALSPRLPEEFTDTFDATAYARSQEYTRVTTRFGFLESTFSLVVFLLFWLLGGYPWLDNVVRSWDLGPIGSGLALITILLLAARLLALPFELYDTFVIEEKFGFNKTTSATFAADLLKGLALSAVIGLPVFALLLFFFRRFEFAWLYAWIAVSGISLLFSYLAPRLILPLFNKFTPLEDGDLKEAIHAMADKCGFPLSEVSVMDGSRRSSKSNAFFTGFGRNKKIALFDTLVEAHTVSELVAVLAHEIGHFKKKHILQQMIFSIVQTGVIFYIFSLFLHNEALFAAFGVKETSVYLSLIFFLILFRPITRILSVVHALWSRRNEYQADAFAAETTGNPDLMIEALKKLSKENLSNLTPHPFHVFMDYSHPPVLARIRALRNLSPAS